MYQINRCCFIRHMGKIYHLINEAAAVKFFWENARPLVVEFVFDVDGVGVGAQRPTGRGTHELRFQTGWHLREASPRRVQVRGHDEGMPWTVREGVASSRP